MANTSNLPSLIAFLTDASNLKLSRD